MRDVSAVVVQKHGRMGSAQAEPIAFSGVCDDGYCCAPLILREAS
jgi:hypothetical protein